MVSNENKITMNENKMTDRKTNPARLATLEVLMTNLFPLFLDPLPTRETLRAWLDDAKIPRFKYNMVAKRGGGHVYYSVAAVEKLMRDKTTSIR